MSHDRSVQIIVPVGMFGASEHDSAIDWAMREIAKAFSPNPDGEWAEKYGTSVENDIFLMKPYCWCDKDSLECPWCIHGDNPDFARALARFGTTEENYAALRDRYYYDPPNFWHKPSNFRVSWHKYIGRDMATNRDISPAELQAIFDDCMRARPSGESRCPVSRR